MPFFAGCVKSDALFIFKIGCLIFSSFLHVFDSRHEGEIADFKAHIEAAVQSELPVGNGVELTQVLGEFKFGGVHSGITPDEERIFLCLQSKDAQRA